MSPLPTAIEVLKRAVKLSIVIPSLNQGPFIEEALLSVLRQEGVRREELEVIVIDGGSADQTLDLLRRFDVEIDYWVSEPDAGQTAALRKGFEVATGAVLGWLCADDLLTPRTARSVLDFFARNPTASFVYGDAIWITRGGQPQRIKREMPFNWFIWLHDHNYIPQPSAFWRRDLYDAVGGLDPSFDLAMDADLFARFALVARPRHLGQIWSLVRRHPEQKTQRLQCRSDQEVRLVRERLGVSCDNRPLSIAKFVTAKSVRALWKMFRGSYAPRPVARKIWAREMQRGSMAP
jgi:glycosyltransferase involved in cell wall biosynthesis